MTNIQADLEFDMYRIARILEPQFNGDEDHDTRPTFEQKTAGNEDPDPGLWFVKDQGIYLMTNLADQPDDNTVYAEGFDPGDDQRVWDRARRAVGGDDFCHYVPWDWYFMAIKDDCEYLTLRYEKDPNHSYKLTLLT